MKEIEEEIKHYTAGSFLSRLWRKIVLNDGYYKILNPLLNDYLQKLVVQAVSNTKISINRTNIYNKILDSSMTWKNFIFLLKEIIRVSELETTITITIADEVSTYSEKGLDGMVLTRLWKQIENETKNMVELIDNYYIREKNNPNKVNKTNLTKKMSANQDMSWNNLMFLIDEILIAREFSITVKIKNRRGLYNKHQITYNIRD